MRETGQYVHFKFFKSSFKAWETLFAEAATFAEGVGREQLIGISHSEDSGKGVVTVWYWANVPRATEE